MKRLISAALALSLLAGGAAGAQPYGHAYGHDRDRDRGRHDLPRGHHHWARGQRLPSSYYRDRNRYIDYRTHHLHAPPRGYRWVQADDNYALVAITSGLIALLVAANH